MHPDERGCMSKLNHVGKAWKRNAKLVEEVENSIQMALTKKNTWILQNREHDEK